MKERQKKIDIALDAVTFKDFKLAKVLVNEVFHGTLKNNIDVGMEGSLLYHMAMISKMSSEHKIILEELKIDTPSVENSLWKFYFDFVSDAKDLLQDIIELNEKVIFCVKIPFSNTEEKISLFKTLSEKFNEIKNLLDVQDPNVKNNIQSLFIEWTIHIVEMRLRQEYETLKGYLIIEELTPQKRIY